MNIEHLVKTALVDTLHYKSVEEINIQDHLQNDLHLDSMGSLIFLMKLEDLIDGFRVDPEKLDSSDLETVSSVIQYINFHMIGESENVH
ncbi:MAG: hypothetical protein ACD_29C00054G0001 [uncultured bacterium]|nr:MAG: hypothetical protein ACD_29C00054G0001 [uncultured bacterium]